jgi:4-hydroxy-tetrahydrodipicolinate reductase
MTLGLAIVGHGKMGKLIEKLAPEFDCEVLARFTSASAARHEGLSRQTLRGVDVAIEFTTPAAAPENIRALASFGINCVAGTTGWFDQLSSVGEAIRHNATALVWSANFSVGVNLFIDAVAHTAALFAAQPDYQAWGWEIHHSQKKDAPSGTLHKLAQDMRAAGYTRPIALSSSRAGAHPGTHEIGFDSAADTITLRHSARSREGFARGALQAARWIAGKKGVFEFREILGQLSPP